MHRLRYSFRSSLPSLVTSFVVSFFCLFRMEYYTTTAWAHEQRTKRSCSATFRFLLLHYVFSAAFSSARRTTLDFKWPAGVPFPIHNYDTNQPENHQRRPPWSFYHRFRSRCADKPTSSFASTIRLRCHRQRPPLRPLHADRCNRRGDRPTISWPTPNRPGITTTHDYVELLTPTLTGYRSVIYDTSSLPRPSPTSLSPNVDGYLEGKFQRFLANTSHLCGLDEAY